MLKEVQNNFKPGKALRQKASKGRKFVDGS